MAYKQPTQKAIKQTHKDKSFSAYQVNLSKVKSDDPLAYSYGYIQGKEGREMSDAKNLAPAYKEGYEAGKKEREKGMEEAYGFAIKDINKGHKTLWTENLKKENPELYKSAVEKSPYKEKFSDEKVEEKKTEIKESYEIQTAKKPADSFKYLKDKDVNIQKRYWSFEVEDNKLRLSLGNFTDAGWYWSGDEKDIVGYTYRLHNSDVEEDFYRDMARNKVSFNQLKPLYLKSAKENDGLYEVSGDNRRWHFGETGVSDSYILEEEGLTEKQKENFYSDYSPISYEEFQGKYGKAYKKDVQEAVKSSQSFREFNMKMDELREKYTQLANEEDENRVYSAVSRAKGESII